MGEVNLIIRGDCLDILRGMEPESVDSLVTDPPAGISFMGKEWDKSHGFIPSMTEIFKECMKVLKPGAHGFVWAIPRTSHWTATALENAGFEIRDVVTHLFGSGFPKSKNCGNGIGTALKPASEHWILVRKPIIEKTVAANVLKHGTGGINIDASRIAGGLIDSDKRMSKGATPNGTVNYGGGMPIGGHEESVRHNQIGRFPANLILSHNPDCVELGAKEIKTDSHMADKVIGFGSRQYNGKENEPIRKYTENVAAFECTPDCAVAALDQQSISQGIHFSGQKDSFINPNTPTNQIQFGCGNSNIRHVDHGSAGASRFFKTLDGCTEGCPVAALDEQSGMVRHSLPFKKITNFNFDVGGNHTGQKFDPQTRYLAGASRFFYCAKTSKSERNAGCEGLPETKREKMASSGRSNKSGEWVETNSEPLARANSHPTVKPKKLMNYLIRMITPSGGLVLDPFAGSGSTGVAAIENGFQFVGIEKEDDYATIAESRIQHALNSVLK